VPPWGGASRLGDRVLAYVKAQLAARATAIGTDQIEVVHEVTCFDPLEVFGSGGDLAESGAHLTTPHFFLKAGTNPKMDGMAAVIKAADCYIVVSPEYNHGIPPALSALMGHFGGSNYMLKPSAIVTYSNGPWGGMRGLSLFRWKPVWLEVYVRLDVCTKRVPDSCPITWAEQDRGVGVWCTVSSELLPAETLGWLPVSSAVLADFQSLHGMTSHPPKVLWLSNRCWASWGASQSLRSPVSPPHRTSSMYRARCGTGFRTRGECYCMSGIGIYNVAGVEARPYV
jgi:NAD(P)H-dependent FMN reductase